MRDGLRLDLWPGRQFLVNRPDELHAEATVRKLKDLGHLLQVLGTDAQTQVIEPDLGILRVVDLVRVLQQCHLLPLQHSIVFDQLGQHFQDLLAAQLLRQQWRVLDVFQRSQTP